MKTIYLPILVALLLLQSTHSTAQVVLNEMYTDPGSGKQEFFELFNYGGTTSTDNFTVVTYFDDGTNKGFYVMDLPDFTLGFQKYFVIASASPFNYQGVTNSTAANFYWNDPTLATKGGYIKKWVLGTANLADGNPNYDEQAIPANFNDFFYHNGGNGNPTAFHVFLYKNGVLKNSFFGGASGTTGAPAVILAMPSLFVDMLGTSPDFTINFSTYNTIKSEWFNANTGNDNGYTRTGDGICKTWQKAAAAVAHTPGYTNGSQIGYGGSLTISTGITRATMPGDSSKVQYNITAGTTDLFPVDLLTYLDNGTVASDMDYADTYLATNTENVVTDGPFTTKFLPQATQIILVAATSAYCIDQTIVIPNTPPATLPMQLYVLDGSLAKQTINLQWKATNNSEINRFEIQRSTNGIDFTATGFVMASESNASENYYYNVTETADKVYYRIRIIAKNSQVSYSPILAFQTKSAPSALNILQNPVKDKLALSFTAPAAGTGNLTIYNMTGNQMWKQNVAFDKGSNAVSLSLPGTIPAGTYIVELRSGMSKGTSIFLKN